MRMQKIAVFTLLTLFIGAPAFAYENTLAPDSALTKFERGAINTTTGWMEVGVQPAEGAQGPRPVSGVFFGVGKGVLKGLQRTGMGLVEVVTFPLPPYDRTTAEPETLFGEPR